MDRKIFSSVIIVLFSITIMGAVNAIGSVGNVSTKWGDIKNGYSTEIQLAPLTKITEADLSKRIFGKVYPVTLRYLDRFPRSTDCTGVHAGIDYGAPKETNVKSATNGKVIKIENSIGGVFVFDGINTIIYAHMTGIEVKKGDKVILGQTILGKVGSKGIATGPHLHLEVRKGYSEFATPCSATKAEVEKKNLNPTSYIK